MNKWPAICFLFSTSISFAQQPAAGREVTAIDSLVHGLAAEANDTARINLALDIADRYAAVHIDSAIAYDLKAIALSKTIKYKAGIALSSRRAASHLWIKSDFHTAQEYLDTALAIYRQAGDRYEAASVLREIGDLNDNGGMYNFPKAMDAYNQSLQIWQTLGRKDKMADLLSAKGTLYLFIDDNEKSIAFLTEALDMYTELHDSLNMASCYMEIGRTYSWWNKYDSAFRNFDHAITLYESLHDETAINRARFLFGVAHMNAGNYGKAVEYFTSTIDLLLDPSSPKHNLCMGYAFLCRSYFGLGNYVKSLEYGREALRLSRETNDLSAQVSAYTYLSATYEKLKQFEKALDAYKNYKILNDSMFNADKSNEILRKDLQADFEKKELRARLEQEKKDIRERNIRRSITGTLVGALVFLAFVFRQRNRISRARKRSDELLLNILPAEVAEELKAKGNAEAKHFDEVTVMFTDFIGFTRISEKLQPRELVGLIHDCFRAFDEITGRYSIEKIKTIGDSYMCAGGLPVAGQTGAVDVVHAALEMRQFMRDYRKERKAEGKDFFDMRIGIHTGPVVAGIVGARKFAYDIWGDTVNIASRMESSGMADKINISGATYELVKDAFRCSHRGKIQAKNKGEIDMYFVESAM